jgi:hypothetical protein
MHHSTYFGVFIWRKTTPGYQLPWTAVVNGDMLAADTLAGIRELIREHTKGKQVAD